jgi:hypothetical protein
MKKYGYSVAKRPFASTERNHVLRTGSSSRVGLSLKHGFSAAMPWFKSRRLYGAILSIIECQ